jgi:hypothetical protein
MSGKQSKADLIAERQANLPLPEDSPTAPDWNRADARNVKVGSGGAKADIDDSTTGLGEPPTTQVSGAGQDAGSRTAPGKACNYPDAIGGQAKNWNS